MNSPECAGAMKTKSNHTGNYNPDENSHFRADSALLEFLGFGLRATEPSLDECKVKPFVVRVRRMRRRGRVEQRGKASI
jgi:hypothetical protein